MAGYQDIVIIVPLGDRSPPGTSPPEPQASLALNSSSYAGDENTLIQFAILRTEGTTERVSVDWAITNTPALPTSGTVTFEVGETQQTVTVDAGEVTTTEVGQLTLSNPQNLDGGITPALITPTTATFTVIDTDFAVNNQTLRAAGYLLVDDYGAVGDGVTDDTVAIQACITAARDVTQAVWFSRDKTYIVSKPLRCFTWDEEGLNIEFSQTEPPQLFGGGSGANRPVIKLANNAPLFQNVNDPHPIFCFRQFQNFVPPPSRPEPADVMDDSGTAQSQANNFFYATLQNFRIDCNQQPGAMGVYFPSAQRCFAADIEIDATGAAIGWEGGLGRNSPITNLKIIGGREQFICTARLSKDGSNGVTITGLELIPDSNTITPFKGQDDAVPTSLTGFNFSSNGFNGTWVDIQSVSGSVRGPVALLDGIVNGGNQFVDNSAGKSIYLRNIWLTNIDDLVQSGSRPVVTDTSTWKRIDEYVYTDQSAISAGSAEYPREVIVDGTFLTQAEPIVDVTSNVGAPTIDYIDAHTIDIHRIDDGRQFVNIGDYITPYVGNTLIGNFFYQESNSIDVSEPDALAALQQAIQDAATAGHNRVFMPRGAVFISGQLDLLPDTKMFGMSAVYSKIGVKNTWRPTSNIAVVRTANDANGTCHWSELSVVTRRWDPPPAPTTAPARQYDNFDWIQWRTGKFSSSVQRLMDKEVGVAHNYTGDHQYHWFTDNGGGRHFGFTDNPGRAYYSVDAIGLRIEGTSQPLHIYGYNPEMGKGGKEATEPQTTYCTIIENASNIRIYGTKREGTGHTIKMINVDNVAHYCGGREHTGYGETNGISATRSAIGASNNFQFVLAGVDLTAEVETANDYLSYEDTTAFPAVGIKHPNLCVLHRRGTLDDDIMMITGTAQQPNRAPVITSIITPVFIQGIASEYDLDQHMSDPDGDALTVIFNAVALPGGVTYQSAPDDNKLIYDGIGATTVSSGHKIKAFDGELESSPSAEFTIEIATAVTTTPITGVTFNLSSVINTTPGNGVSAPESDNWPVTWAADGHQYTSFGDGRGFGNLSGFPSTRGSFGFSRIEGTQSNYSAFDVFKSGEAMPGEQGKCYGMLGVNGKLYAAVDYFLVGGSGSREDRYHGLSLISSNNAGASWTEHIRWDSAQWGANQLNGFYSMSFVQYGQDHGGTRSPKTSANYVYAIVSEHDDDVYEVQNPGGISLMRCLATNLETGNHNHWEYLSNIDANNDPSWSTTITDRIKIFEDTSANGGNDSSSISYNAPLGRYVLTVMQNSRYTSTHPSLANTCIIGIYEAPEPWGPWTQVIKENVETLGIADGNACIYWNFSNKWLSSDGLNFVMAGTLPGQDEWGTIEGTFQVTSDPGFVFPEEHFSQGSVNPGAPSLILPANNAMLVIGMSNTQQYTEQLIPLANPTSKTTIVNGAQGGAAATQWAISTNTAWTVAAQELSNAGFTASEVSVVFIAMVDRVLDDTYEDYRIRLEEKLRQVVVNVRQKYPNAIMIMNGLHNEFWATSHPEPHAWASNSIADTIINDTADVYWGPYIWTPIGGRSGDGFEITEADHQPDGNVHLTTEGSLKVAQMIMTWFQTDSVGRSIFE